MGSFVLHIPGVEDYANVAVAGGAAAGKTPLRMLANKCGNQYREASRHICAWLLETRADPDLGPAPEKGPLSLAVGSRHADMVESLLEARASVDRPRGPGLDAILTLLGKVQPAPARSHPCVLGPPRARQGRRRRRPLWRHSDAIQWRCLGAVWLFEATPPGGAPTDAAS